MKVLMVEPGKSPYGIYNNGELVDTYTTGPDASFMTRYFAKNPR